MTRAHLVLLFSFPLLFLNNLQAQNEGVSFSSPVIEDEMTQNPEQNQLWRTGQSKYSAKPKHMWELGLHGGTAFISGDVEATIPSGYGFGIHLRKAINYTLSWRLDATYQTSKGFDARSFNYLSSEKTYTQNIDQSPILVGYTDESNPEDNIARNYKTDMVSVSLEGILNIGNVLFHGPTNKWNLYTAIGVGLSIPEEDCMISTVLMMVWI
jgi:hypothetical protein